ETLIATSKGYSILITKVRIEARIYVCLVIHVNPLIFLKKNVNCLHWPKNTKGNHKSGWQRGLKIHFFFVLIFNLSILSLCLTI
ncbi:hypothetical protein ACJX0J_005378, partial [Zea mays]